MTFKTISEIKRANRAAGQHFFEPDTMRFFRSRVLPTLHQGRYFVTSEQFEGSDGRRDARRYTVREAKPDGTVDTVSEFQEFAAAREAHKAAESIEQVSVTPSQALHAFEKLRDEDGKLDESVRELAYRLLSVGHKA